MLLLDTPKHMRTPWIIGFFACVSACDSSAAPVSSRTDATANIHDVVVPDTDATPDTNATLDVATMADTAKEVAVTTDAEKIPDVAVDVASCSDPMFIRSLRTGHADGVSLVAAPGSSFESLRSRMDALPASVALLTTARSMAAMRARPLATGDSAYFQAVASYALAAAFVAWHDRDLAAARRSMEWLSIAAITPAWLNTAQEIPIRVGGSLVLLAGAVDLLTASPLSPSDVMTARSYVGRAAMSVDAWIHTFGIIFVLAHRDNHSVRLGSGLVTAALVSNDVSDDALAYGLTMLDDAVHEGQTGGEAGWAEGSTYFSYAFEVGAVALSALEGVWVGADTRCTRCPGYLVARCSEGYSIRRPGNDPLLAALTRWAASLETVGGWLHPFDDSRITTVSAPLLERMGNVRVFRHWSIAGPPGSVGDVLRLGPFVALALATQSNGVPETPARVHSAAGTARLETVGRTTLEALMVAEHGVAAHLGGHERPDTLGLVFSLNGVMMLGASGYGNYETRAPYAMATSSSVITLAGLLPETLGAGDPGPEGRLTETPDGAVVGSMSGAGVTVQRTLSVAPDVLTIRDRITVSETSRSATWHWHLRGALDATTWTWTHTGFRCTATQSGLVVTSRREMGAHIDLNVVIPHPVLRQTAVLPVGESLLTTRIQCDRI
jgi:hypothetical protein